ncbi:hypothetical protein ACELLULO517_21895 [Acidisoma cellulosilytica]|uniref:Cation efflux protein transmembrane domain-containing protein n=1 Tax=Acidisoma cellulosilyticum TaxID=2802395 RepID=A0A964E5P7_9PROT|nr:cation transporter [Acidisoma cellulosilyticum]MCB8882915.1 hypothetical protein [Acidisoma cellulosilyticum]
MKMLHTHSKILPNRLLRRGLWLEYATLAWNVVGTPVMIAMAIASSSTAMAGFGLDSLIEIFASVVVIWQLKGEDSSNRERIALRLIGAAFYLLAAYVLIQSIWMLANRHHPVQSSLGIAWLALTVVTMVSLAYGKLVTGRALGNIVLRTEARVTMIDAALAAAVLCGVGLNALLGWWWADPLSGLVIVFYGVKEGRAALGHVRDG